MNRTEAKPDKVTVGLVVFLVLMVFACMLGGCSAFSGLGQDLHWMAEMLKPAPLH